MGSKLEVKLAAGNSAKWTGHRGEAAAVEKARGAERMYGYTEKTNTVAQHGLAAMSSGVRAVMPGDCSSVGSN